MLGRRDVMQAGAAAGLVLASGGIALAPVARVVVDARYADSAQFAAAWSAPAARVTDGDVTRLWTADLRPLWRSRPVAIAGLTGRDVLFCLEQLGAAAGMRLAHKLVHRRWQDGRMAHEIPAAIDARPWREAGVAYPHLAARALQNCATGAGRVSSACPSPGEGEMEPLVSWLMVGRV
jgi:hypothetical protein